MEQRGAALAAAIALATLMTACTPSFFTSPPTGIDQQFTIGVAMKGAQVGCARLANKALRQGEVEDLKKSLDYVSGLLTEQPDIDAAELAEDLASASPEVGAFAPEILLVATAVSSRIPKEQRQATYFIAVTGVVNQCRRALGEGGTAMREIAPGANGVRELRARAVQAPCPPWVDGARGSPVRPDERHGVAAAGALRPVLGEIEDTAESAMGTCGVAG